ncbi:TonB family protein [Arenibacterium sp. LLYu02]|uniref:TonB family protein n=1 Tax=Arenibacterium sp. LLYu02 TaxID=3404132 RepID=UPI003B21396C
MIPRSPLMAVCALFAALAAHAALLVEVEPPAVEIEGGGSTAPAALGSSFADLALGTLQPVAAEQSTVQPSPSVQPRVTPPVPAAVSPVSAPPVAALTPSVPQPTKPAPPEQTAALAETPSEQAPETSKRPSQRPEPAKPAPRGNSAQNAKAGTETGAEENRAKSAPSAQAAAAASGAGNAAVSNYPGLVMRQISRQRKPRTSIKGVAQVSFAIDANGGLASVRIAQSSGSAELDDLALRQIRQAAPFPPPPSGARRQYTIAIKGR